MTHPRHAGWQVLKGAQGNFPVERILSTALRAFAKQGTADMMVAQFLKPMLRTFYAAPGAHAICLRERL